MLFPRNGQITLQGDKVGSKRVTISEAGEQPMDISPLIHPTVGDPY